MGECNYCAGPLTGRQRKWCSVWCKNQAGPIERGACIICMTELPAGFERYCSEACRREQGNRLRQAKSLADKTMCDYCGLRKIPLKRQKYCSDECSDASFMRSWEDRQVVEKRCPRCQLVKPLLEFGRDRQHHTGRSTYCKPCNAAKGREYQPSEEAKRKRRDAVLRQTYSITLEELESLIEEQGGVCPVCAKPPSARGFVVDHNHETGVVRGALCNSCNLRVIGRHKDGAIFARAAEYLNNPPAVRHLGERIAPPKKKKKRAPRKRKR